MLTRPRFDSIGYCWRATLEDEFTMTPESMEPVLPSEEWEWKVGWSTNTVKVGDGEYLVGWHGVLKRDNSYHNGIALVDREGNLVATTDYILSPQKLPELLGDRPFVIFGCGLVKYKELLVWVGGVADHAIGFSVSRLARFSSL